MTRVALTLRALGLGDFVTGLPAMQLLRERLPAHQIVALVPGPVASALLDTGLVDRTITVSTLRPLWEAPFAPDVAVDLHGNGPASRDLLGALRPRRLVAFRPGGPRWDPAERETQRWCRLVRECFGGDGTDPSLTGILRPYPAPYPVGAGCTVVHPGAGSPSRRWPVQRFVEVVRRLLASGHRVAVTGTPPEQDLVHEVVAAAPGALAQPRATVTQLCGLVSHARLVVSGDTGVAHVAAAYATPSVVLAGPVPPAQWGPPLTGPHRALWPAGPDDPSGDPHGSTVDPVLLRTTVDDVLAAVAEVDQPAGRP